VDWILLQNRYRFIGNEPLPVPDPSTPPATTTATGATTVQRYCDNAAVQEKVLAEVTHYHCYCHRFLFMLSF
jgi:hypothetical protein